jgi:hypothetical protein
VAGTEIECEERKNARKVKRMKLEKMKEGQKKEVDRKKKK